MSYTTANDVDNLRETLSTNLQLLPPPTAADTPRTRLSWQKLCQYFVGAARKLSRLHTPIPEDSEEEDSGTAKSPRKPRSPPRHSRPGPSRNQDDDQDDQRDDDEEEDVDKTRVATPPPHPDQDQDHDQDDDQAPSKPAKLTKEQRDARAHTAVVTRVEKIIGAMSQPALTPTDLISRISEPPALTMDKAEDLAFTCIVRGFTTPAHNWKITTRPFVRGASSDILEFVQGSAELDSNQDTLEMDYRLSQTTSKNALESYLFDVLVKIETIRFAKDWNRTGAGTVTYKDGYNKRLFQKINAPVFRDADDATKVRLMKEYAEDFGTFKRNREKLVTARNRLATCYDSFGTAILIDPFFDTRALESRSKKFQALITTLANLAPRSTYDDAADNENRFTDNEPEHRDLLVALLRTLSPSPEEADAVENYIADFFKKHSLRGYVER
ncbi:hypothetical protein B0H11DRAFT_2249463 [Mycena galericulata]|nr:hypothetical protein B0H11DRAFT_2249463 [Mycena galericulata]